MEWSKGMGKGRGRKINLELGIFGMDFKRKNEKEERKKTKQIKESNGTCHWEGFKLMRKKKERKVKKRRDKYILQILIT